ncbi:MAG: HDIG domain-containing protein [Planctomycetales bacterium]|nr:HDIG domain-containing protein [Planctomycetales bacterium]
MLVILEGWKPPFAFREGQIPSRDLVARVAFEIVDAKQTDLLRDQKRREVLCYYENRPIAITQLFNALKDQMLALMEEVPLEQLNDTQRNVLNRFIPPDEIGRPLSPVEALQLLREFLSQSEQLEKFDQAVRSVLDEIAESGTLNSLSHDMDQGSQRSIKVINANQPDDEVFVDVTHVRITEIASELPARLQERFQQSFTDPVAITVAKMVASYLDDHIPVTLSYRQDLSEQARRRAEESVEDATVSYFPTVSRLAQAGVPISADNELPLLRAEYDAWIGQLSIVEVAIRTLAFVGMITALFMLCGLYIYHQHDARLIGDTGQLARLLGLMVVTCLLCRIISPDPWRAELVAIVLSAVTSTIAFGRQVSLLLSACLSLCITLGIGLDLAEFVTLCSGCCAVALLMGRIRTRTKLIYVGLAVAGIVGLTHLGVDIVSGNLQFYAPPSSLDSDPLATRISLGSIVGESLRLSSFAFIACSLMTGLLPFVERIFGVQTDLSLLELGDASHPLLRQLAQRAPGTYNHSINVAAIAEAAADVIGAHGLLTRVGAYFHDIGKMFKPNYFIENQEQGGNCHDTLQPAMSTLVIIAHVKDGADLGRQHHLPKPIIDFIEQHHGTTLVEYFYREAAKRSQIDPDKGEVSETSFRYPGPKPQTLEAAVLMLADSVESASRTLVEPTSSRIQNLVDQIAMKKLLDGQFDQCGLTLQQLDRLKQSLVKSLTAIYHGRVKYSGQATA